jgi:four helix bundle protein
MEHKFSFEKLDVWHDARLFVKDIYLLTSKFPKEEKYGLCSQLQRAAVSVISNITEGTSRFSDKEKLRFIEISYTSLMEVYCQLIVSLDLEYLNIAQLENQKLTIFKISNKLTALYRSIQKRMKDNDK